MIADISICVVLVIIFCEQVEQESFLHQHWGYSFAFAPNACNGVRELMVKIQGYVCQEHW